MATPKKPTNKNPEPKKVPEFDFKEYEKIRSLYGNVSLLMGCLKETKEKVAIDDLDKADFKELSNAIQYIMSAFSGAIVNYSKTTADVKGLLSLYKEIYTKLMDRLNSLGEDYTNRYNIIKAKLEEMEEDKRKYVDFQLKGMQAVTEDTEDKEWKHGPPSFEDIIRNLISGGLGVKFPKGKHAMIIDENGCYFK